MQIAATDVTSKDIVMSFDLFLAKFEGEKAEDAEGKAIATLEGTLKAISYGKPMVVRSAAISQQRAKSAGRTAGYTAETASETAKGLYAAAFPNHPLPAKASPVSIQPSARQITNEAADGEASQAQVTSATTEAASFELPDQVRRLFKAPKNALKSIGLFLAKSSGNRFQSGDDLIGAFQAVEKAAKDAEAGLAEATAALERLQAGETGVEEPALVPNLQYSPIPDLKFDPDAMVNIDAVISAATSDEDFTFMPAIEALVAAERSAIDLISKQRNAVAAFRKAKSAIAPAAPAVIIRAKAEVEELPPHDIVMKNARQVFAGRSFGADEDALDFEVPTIDWHDEKHAFVPKVDPIFRFRIDALVGALDSIEANTHTWMTGESGCGKTDFWRQVSAHLGLPFTRVNFDVALTRSHLVGSRQITHDPERSATITTFLDGVLPRALARPGIMLFDEFDCGDPQLMPVLQPILDGDGLQILEDGGRIVKPHPLCRIAAAANTIGLGSDNGIYNSVHEISGATRNRFVNWIEMSYPTEEIEYGIILARQPNADPDFVRSVVTFANRARQAYRDGDSSFVFSMRNVVEAARKHARFSKTMEKGQAIDFVMRHAALQAADPMSRTFLVEAIDNIFATTIQA